MWSVDTNASEGRTDGDFVCFLLHCSCTIRCRLLALFWSLCLQSVKQFASTSSTSATKRDELAALPNRELILNFKIMIRNSVSVFVYLVGLFLVGFFQCLFLNFIWTRWLCSVTWYLAGSCNTISVIYPLCSIKSSQPNYPNNHTELQCFYINPESALHFSGT